MLHIGLYKDSRGATVIGMGIGYGDMSSNHKQICLHFT